MGKLRCRCAFKSKLNLLNKIVKNPAKYSQKYLEHLLEKDFIFDIEKIPKRENICHLSENYVEVFNTCNMGKGIRAKMDLIKGQRIGCYMGELKRSKEESEDWRYNFTYAIRGFYIDGKNGSLMSYLNHSSKPNVDVIWESHKVDDDEEIHLVFRLNKDVEILEELFIDYGEEYWNYAKKQGIIKTTKQRLITEFFSSLRTHNGDLKPEDNKPVQEAKCH